MQLEQIKLITENKKRDALEIDAMIEDAQKPVASKSFSASAVDSTNTTEDEKVVLELKTAWPIVKAVFAFVRPFLVFKPKWKTIVDRFMAAMDIMIPE